MWYYLYTLITEGNVRRRVAKFTIWTDGAARGKKSSGFIAAAGFVVKDLDDNLVYAAARCLGEQTNNTAEYVGLIMALDWVLKELPQDLLYVHFKSDSELMVRQVTRIYEVHDVGLRVLCNGAIERLRKLHHYRVEHIRREYNVQADAMCNRVLDAEKKSGVTFVEDDPSGRYSLGNQNSGGSTGHVRPAEDSGLEGQSRSHVSRDTRLGVRGRGGKYVDLGVVTNVTLTSADSAAKERFAANRLGPALRQV